MMRCSYILAVIAACLTASVAQADLYYLLEARVTDDPDGAFPDELTETGLLTVEFDPDGANRPLQLTYMSLTLDGNIDGFEDGERWWETWSDLDENLAPIHLDPLPEDGGTGAPGYAFTAFAGASYVDPTVPLSVGVQFHLRFDDPDLPLPEFPAVTDGWVSEGIASSSGFDVDGIPGFHDMAMFLTGVEQYRVTLVPEPASAAGVLGGLGVLLARRPRRRDRASGRVATDAHTA